MKISSHFGLTIWHMKSRIAFWWNPPFCQDVFFFQHYIWSIVNCCANIDHISTRVVVPTVFGQFLPWTRQNMVEKKKRLLFQLRKTWLVVHFFEIFEDQSTANCQCTSKRVLNHLKPQRALDVLRIFLSLLKMRKKSIFCGCKLWKMLMLFFLKTKRPFNHNRWKRYHWDSRNMFVSTTGLGGFLTS